jgi:(p)ppGpp synthase/HD superfamily hydrolase
MGTIEKAIAIAATAHAGQRDKAGEPYILHPLRVMLRLSSEEERIVAILHDVVEDTDWTFERLREEGFSNEVVDAIDSVTKREGETYNDFVDRAGRNAIGRRVKLADLEDNSDLSRIAKPTQKDYQRLEKYRVAIARIQRYTTAV